MKRLSKLFSSKKFRLGLGIIISLGAFYLALQGVELQEVWQAIQNAQGRFVILALIGVVLNTLGKTWRWRLLVGSPGQKISTPTYLLILLAGQMLNTLFPARLGDLARAYTLGGRGPGRTYVLGTIMIEKMLDSLAYIALFGIIILLIPVPQWIGGSILAFIGVILTLVIVILLFIFWPAPFKRVLNTLLARLPARQRQWLAPRLEQGLASLEILRRRADILRLILWTILIWALAVSINHFTLLALGIHLPLTAALLILFGLQAGISLPAIPGTIGVFEYICILALAVFDIDQGLALSYGLLLHAIVLVPSTLAGMASFWILGLSGQREKFQQAATK